MDRRIAYVYWSLTAAFCLFITFRALGDLTQKYGLIKRIFSLVARVRGQRAVYIAVQPAAREE